MHELRCRPGDLARVIYSKLGGVAGRIVFVEGGVQAPDGSHRWSVTLFGGPVMGVGSRSGRPRVTHKLTFRDSSLEPLRPEALAITTESREVDHA